jgi:N-glycosylase/DNA lyase
VAEPRQHDQRLDSERPVPLTLSLPAEPAVDLASTLDGGQAFRWRPEGGGYRGVIGRRVYRLSERPGGIALEACDGAPIGGLDAATVRRYLGLDYDFADFVARFAADPCIGPALRDWPGLRVLRQDRWECLVAFVCSSTSNIPRIKRDVDSLATAFGDRVGPGPHDFTFPKPGRLAAAGEAALRKLGLGFRARSVARAAESVATSALDLDAVAVMPYRDALAALTALHGVGEKVADCALAFAFDKPEAFPVDRWVKRALVEWYALPEKLSNRKAAEFARTKFRTDAAYVNQYLFHRQRMTAPAGITGTRKRALAGSGGAASRKRAPRLSS